MLVNSKTLAGNPQDPPSHFIDEETRAGGELTCSGTQSYLVALQGPEPSFSHAASWP